MATSTASDTQGGGLKAALQDTLSALGERAMHSASERVTGMTERLTNLGDGEGDGDGGGGMAAKVVGKAAEAKVQGESPAKGAIKGALSSGKDKITQALGGGKGGGKNPKPAATKAMNFVESIDVGVPVTVAYNQWTQYRDWPSFMKKVETAEQEDDTPKVTMKAQVFWFHRDWQSTIIDQIPDERIVWRSTGRKGHIDGCVTFHELAPRLTRILVQLEYYPQGLIERVGNIWRTAGRRARLEIKHFRRHVMMNVILNPDEVEGWRGEIEDREVIRTHDEVVEEEQRAAEEEEERENQQDREGEESGEAEQGEESGEGEQGEESGEGEEGPEDEADLEEDREPDEDEDEYEEDEGEEDEGEEDQGEEDQDDDRSRDETEDRDEDENWDEEQEEQGQEEQDQGPQDGEPQGGDQSERADRPRGERGGRGRGHR